MQMLDLQSPKMALADTLASLESKSDEQLKQMFIQLLAWDSQSLVQKAAIVHTLKKRGHDLGNLGGGALVPLLVKIACGQLDAEAVVRFGSRRNLLKRLEKLPLSEQRSLVDEKIKLLTYDESGKRTHRVIPLSELPSENLSQVFADDHIRSESEQAVFLDNQLNKSRRKRRPDEERLGKVRIDRVTRTVKAGSQVFSFDEWKEIAKIL